MMRAIFITMTIVLLITVSPAQESVTVPCKAEKCRALDLFNQIVDLRNAEDDDLKQIEQSLIHDPPSYTVALDRQADIEAAIKKSAAVEALYKDAHNLAQQRTAAYRRMLAIEKK